MKAVVSRLSLAKRCEPRYMKRREAWQPVLDAEVEKWSAKSCPELIAQLNDVEAYQVDVDDGSMPASLRPLGSSFIREKQGGEKGK